MASSPRATTSLKRQPKQRQVSANTPTVLLADFISYGYAAVVILGTLQFDLQLQLWHGVVMMALFVMLRAVANELRKDARRDALREARRMSALRAQSPSRWNVEQRDGLGRRVDAGA